MSNEGNVYPKMSEKGPNMEANAPNKKIQTCKGQIYKKIKTQIWKGERQIIRKKYKKEILKIQIWKEGRQIIRGNIKKENYINLARLTLWIEFSNEFPYVIPLSLPVIAGPIRKARKIV